MWTHSMCNGCWIQKNGLRPAVRTKDRPVLICCFCGTLTTSGIFVRADPAKTPCEGSGVHEDN